MRDLARVLRQPTWIKLALATIAFSVICTGLGRWQWDRYESRSAANHRVKTNYDAPPLDIAEVTLTGTPAVLPSHLDWRQVRVTGTYLQEQTVLVRNRPLDAKDGYEVMVPVRLADGRLFWIDRGWIPSGSSARESSPIPAPPSGQVTVQARLRPFEEARTDPASMPDHQVSRISPANLVAATGLETSFGAFADLVREQPRAAVTPKPFPRPDPSGGLNLAYAIQWWAFALAGYVLYFRYALREANPASGPQPTGKGGTTPGRAGRPPRKPRRLTDEEIEDAQIENTR